MIISLDAGGMTIRDIGHHRTTTIGTELFHETIAHITDAVLDAVVEWQPRPPGDIYPVIYLEAIDGDSPRWWARAISSCAYQRGGR